MRIVVRLKDSPVMGWLTMHPARIDGLHEPKPVLGCVETWTLNYRPLEKPKLHGSIAWMLGTQDVSQVQGIPNATPRTKLIKPVGDYLPAKEIRFFWLHLPLRMRYLCCGSSHSLLSPRWRSQSPHQWMSSIALCCPRQAVSPGLFWAHRFRGKHPF